MTRAASDLTIIVALSPLLAPAAACATDCNYNGIPDACESDCGPAGGECDIHGCGTANDCNDNSVLDDCDAPQELAKLFRAAGDPQSGFGSAVAMTGDLAVIGFRTYDGSAGESQGAAYIFDISDPLNPVQLVRLVANDAEDHDHFGESVAVSGNLAIIGATQAAGPADNDQGAAYLFDLSDPANPSQVAKLTASDGQHGDLFGLSVSLNENIAIVGAPLGGGRFSTGAAYVFDVSDPAFPVELAKITASDGDILDLFGNSVSQSRDVAIIGASLGGPIGTDAGSAYLFSLSEPAHPEELAKLTASDAQPDDEFGVSVSIDGDLAIVGAQRDDGYTTDQGSAYVFDISDATNPLEVAKLTASNPTGMDIFGRVTSISGRLVIIGAPHHGSAYLFDVSHPANPVTLLELLPTDASSDDRFGASVFLRDEMAIVGALKSDTPAGNNQGAAYIFDVSDTPDCNGNGTPDSCDIAAGNSDDSDDDGVPDECTAFPGDCETDGDIDLLDYGCFADCFSGPDGTAPDDCGIFGFDDDTDVDLIDWGALQSRFTGV